MRYLAAWTLPDDLDAYRNLRVLFSVAAGVDQLDVARIPPAAAGPVLRARYTASSASPAPTACPPSSLAATSGHLVVADVLAALDGHLSAVILDVTDPKPRSDNDPLWRHPKIWLTPTSPARRWPRAAPTR